MIDLFLPQHRKDVLPWLSILGLIGVLLISLKLLWGQQESLYGGLLAIDAYSLFLKIAFLGLGILIILTSIDFVKKFLDHPGEFYGLLLFSILGMNLMAQSREPLTAYLSLELLSFSLYVLVSYGLENAKSNEASIKYIIIGAFSSAIMLYGISLIYSALGVTHFASISMALTDLGETNFGSTFGIVFILVGLAFKISAVPFHMWAPDVYEGSPTSITSFFSIVPKIAALTVFIRFLYVPFISLIDHWQMIIVFISI
jgi:NADH-quinone oxidoreductase subunit N